MNEIILQMLETLKEFKSEDYLIYKKRFEELNGQRKR